MQILVVAGARPNFIKIDPILRALDRSPERFRTTVVHTGQHYDDQMSDVFFRELGIRRPDINLGVGSGSHASQTAAVLVGIEKILVETKHDLLLVVGDVNSTMAGSLAAAKLCVPVAHVEAGLRSGDRTMPEEINRLVTDAISDLLFTSSRDGDENLLREGVPAGKIHFVGNVMIDTLLRCRDLALQSSALTKLDLRPRDFALLTLHRPSNVDDRAVFERLLDALEWLQQRLPIVFPAHPRTTAQIERHDLSDRVRSLTNLRILPPQSYLDFLALQSAARIVLTDSGGVQEETTVLGVPCLTLRANTERPVTCSHGTNQLVGQDPSRIITACERVLSAGPITPKVPEFWDGHAAERIAEVLRNC